jgi:hypothetical protein
MNYILLLWAFKGYLGIEICIGFSH